MVEVKIYDLDITYEMETRAVSVEVEGGYLFQMVSGEGLSVYVALGDGVGTVDEELQRALLLKKPSSI